MRTRGSVKFLGWGLALVVGWCAVTPDWSYCFLWNLEITVNPGSGNVVEYTVGAVTKTCGGACDDIVPDGTSYTFSAIPAAGYVFVRWQTPTGPSVANPITIFLPVGSVLALTADFRLNHPPVLQPIGDRTVDEGALLTFDLSATDPDAGDVITYSALNLPAGASFVGRNFSWQPEYNQAGTYQVTFRADDGNAIDQQTVTITVNNVNRAPVLSRIGDKRTSEDALLEFPVTATDADGDRLTFSASGLPSGAVFGLQRAMQTFSWIPGPNQHGSYPVTFSVTDGAATDSETITITVHDVTHPPVLSPIGNQSVDAGHTLTIQVSASDPDEDPLTFSASPLPPGATLDPGTGIFQWTPRNSQSGPHQVAFGVSDGIFTVTETVTIAVGVGLPVLPDPFPFNQVSPPSGSLTVDPTQPLCLIWPGATNAEAYEFLLARDPSFGLSMVDVPGLGATEYCLGGAAASRTGSGTLVYGMNYFWTVISSNEYGSVQYPVFGFSTLFPAGATVSAPGPFPGMQYTIFSIPLYPEDPDPVAVLSDDLGPYLKSNWRLFYYSSTDGQNHEYPDVPAMAPGVAYWLITRTERTFDAQGSPASTAEDFAIQIPPGFMQVGCPFHFPVSWNEVKVRHGQFIFQVTDPANSWISPVLWTYTNGNYEATQELVPWKGCMVQNVSTETVELLIPPRMYVNPAVRSALSPVSITKNR